MPYILLRLGLKLCVFDLNSNSSTKSFFKSTYCFRVCQATLGNFPEIWKERAGTSDSSWNPSSHRSGLKARPVCRHIQVDQAYSEGKLAEISKKNFSTKATCLTPNWKLFLSEDQRWTSGLKFDWFRLNQYVGNLFRN